MDGKSKTMDTVYDCCVTSHERHNGRTGIITIKNHSATNVIHMRQHFQVMCGIWKKL